MSTGWKKSRINRARSLSSPKASRWWIHWAMLPGKTATKKSASSTPTSARLFVTRISAASSAISTAPEGEHGDIEGQRYELGYLGLELRTREGQVPDPREHHERREGDTADGPGRHC